MNASVTIDQVKLWVIILGTGGSSKLGGMQANVPARSPVGWHARRTCKTLRDAVDQLTTCAYIKVDPRRSFQSGQTLTQLLSRNTALKSAIIVGPTDHPYYHLSPSMYAFHNTSLITLDLRPVAKALACQAGLREVRFEVRDGTNGYTAMRSEDVCPLIQGVPGLRSLRLCCRDRIGMSMGLHLAQQLELTHLDMHDAACDSGLCLKSVSMLLNLKELEFPGIFATTIKYEDGYATLSRLACLTKLTSKGSNIPLNGLHTLTGLLDVNFAYGTFTSIASIASLTNVRSLNIIRCSIISVDCLTSLTKLTSLRMDSCTNIVHINLFSALHLLTHLTCSHLRLICMPNFSAQKDLVSLDIGHYMNINGGPINLHEISALTQLKTLIIDSCDDLADISPLSTLTTLTLLNISHNPNVMKLGVDTLRVSLTNLTSLDVHRCGDGISEWASS